MSVEIVILSGTRQGERHRLDGHRFVVGDAGEADVAFNPNDTPSARGRQATLDASEQGWTLTNHGAGEWLVNQTPVASGNSMRLRSGDVVRLSEEGPDFRFSIVSARDPHAFSVPAPIEAGGTGGQGTSDYSPAPEEDADPVSLRRSRMAMIALGGGLVLVLAVAGWGLGRLAKSDPPPRAIDDTATVEVGQSVRIAVLQNDQDELAERLTVKQLDTSSTTGTAALNSDGSVAYGTAGEFEQLRRGEVGTDTFLYTVRDPAGQESQATVRIQVLRPPDFNRPPVAAGDTARVSADASAQLAVLTNDTDPDGDPLTVVRLVLDGTQGSATIGSHGVIQYHAPAAPENANPSGMTSDSLGYVVADGHGGEATGRVTITVTNPEPPDFASQADKLANACVYLILEIKGQKFPLCSGWALRPDLVVSTATHLSVFEERRAKGDSLFVGYGGAEPRFVPVEDVFVHPLFDKEASDSPVSRAHNVGLVTLKAPLPSQCEVARAAALPKPPTGMQVAVLAYRLTVEPDFQPFNILDPPAHLTVQGSVRGMEVPAGSTNGLPLLLLDAKAPAGSEGAAVLDEQGQVVGVLGAVTVNPYVVLCDQLDPLLPQGK